MWFTSKNSLMHHYKTMLHKISVSRSGGYDPAENEKSYGNIGVSSPVVPNIEHRSETVDAESAHNVYGGSY